MAVATLGGVGRLPLAPGTWGSLAALPIWWALSPLGLGGYGLVWLAMLAVGLWAADRAVGHLGHRDDPAVVIDEAVGQLVALAAVPPSWLNALLGLTIFRALDIVKPWPIRTLERLPGGAGVMADDLAAGGLAWVVVQVVLIWRGGGG